MKRRITHRVGKEKKSTPTVVYLQETDFAESSREGGQGLHPKNRCKKKKLLRAKERAVHRVNLAADSRALSHPRITPARSAEEPPGRKELPWRGRRGSGAKHSATQIEYLLSSIRVGSVFGRSCQQGGLCLNEKKANLKGESREGLKR